MYKILLCTRYLRTRYIALASIISVMLGVATMIVVNSVMAGFSTEMRDRIHGILADIVIETNNMDGAPDAEKHLALVRKAAGDSVEGMTATIEVYGMLSFQYAGQYITRPVTLIGVQPEGKAKVGPLVDYLESYNEVRDGDTVVRGPLRSRDVPPGWELTDRAAKYRSQWVSRQLWLREQFRGQPGTDEDAGPFDPAHEADAARNADGPDFVDDEPKHVDLHSTPRAPRATPDNPFATQPAVAAPNGEADPAAPLSARLYVGVGLISFPYEDSETGKIRTMMMVHPGDDVKLSSVTAGRPPSAVHFNATVVDVFKSGMSEYDSNLVFCNLEELQRVRGMIDPGTGTRSITSIQIKLNDYADADDVVRRLRAAFPPGVYTVRTWEQKQGPLLAAVEVESAILNVLLFLIIAVAGFGILAIFFMIVVEKTRDIGILKALGASSRGVMSIFLSYGLGLGIVGSGVGVVMGLLFVKYINQIEKGVTWLTGRKVFDERIYYFPEIPTSVSGAMVFWVAAGAMTIAVLASILPARRAARLHPVEALRYE